MSERGLMFLESKKRISLLLIALGITIVLACGALLSINTFRGYCRHHCQDKLMISNIGLESPSAKCLIWARYVNGYDSLCEMARDIKRFN